MQIRILIIGLILIFASIVDATYLNQNSSWDFGITSSLWASVAVGDINDDEYLDFVEIGCTDNAGGHCNSYLAKVYINNGTSFVENLSWEANLKPVNYGSIALGDINNDGYLDLALSGCFNGGGSNGGCGDDFSAIYINNGTSFVESASWKGDIVNAWKNSLAFGDINLDGKLDIVLTGSSNVNGYISRIYINNGTAFKESSIWEQSLTGVFGSSATLVDVDNDGRLDLFLVGDTGGSGYTARAYINNGTSFVENSSWESNLLGMELTSTVWGDFDNNGRMDLSLIGHTSSDEHNIYNNTGNSLMLINSRAGTLIGIFEGTQALGDYNNDGNLDIFASGEEMYSTLYTNTSSSYLDDPESGIFNTAFGPSAAWTDVNNDDTLDLLLIGYDKDIGWFNAHVYTNNITIKNTAPSSPTTLNANYSNGILSLSWNAGSDAETPTAGLYYNLRVGTTSGGNQIVTGVYGGGDDNGYFGNMMQRKNILLNINLSGTIYWSVQTIDTGLKASAWATERVYNISSGGQSQANDTAAPNVMITSPVNGSTLTSSSVSISASYNDTNNVTCNTKLDGGSFIAMSLTGSKNGIATYTFSSVADGQHTVYVNCTDVYNNSITRNVTFTVSVPVTPPPPGGGPGGGGLIVNNRSNTSSTNSTPAINQTTSPVNRTENTIIPGETKTITFTNSVMITASIKVRNTVRNIRVDASGTEKPLTVETPASSVYSYIEIKHENITDSDIKTVKISFSVEKSWLLENDINESTVSLNRYDDGWQQLNTTLVDGNSTHYQYESITPGFSLFAITGEKNNYIVPSNSNYYLPAGIAVIAFAVFGGYFYYRRPRKEKSTTAAPAASNPVSTP